MNEDRIIPEMQAPDYPPPLNIDLTGYPSDAVTAVHVVAFRAGVLIHIGGMPFGDYERRSLIASEPDDRA